MRLIASNYLSRFRATEALDLSDTRDLYRPPSISSGKRGNALLVTEDVACKVWPAAKAPRLVAVFPDLAASRIAAIGFVATTTDIQIGDELRSGATKQKIEGVAVWRSITIVALSEVKP